MKKHLNKKIPLVLDELKKYDLDEKFVEAAVQSYAIISGFFLCKCLKKKFRENNGMETDIDIYIDIRKIKNVEKYRNLYLPERYIRNIYSLYHNEPTDLLPIEKYLLEKIELYKKNFYHTEKSFSSMSGYGFDNLKLLSVNNFKLPKIQIQLIYLNCSVNQFIKNQFDFNFLKNCFDGKNLWSYDYAAFRTKTSPFNTNLEKIINYQNEKIRSEWKKSDLILILARCLKYKNRGFKITNLDDILKMQINIIYKYCPFRKKNIIYEINKYDVEVLKYYLKCNPKNINMVRRCETETKPITNIEIAKNILFFESENIYKNLEKSIQFSNNSLIQKHLSFVIHKYYDIGKKVYQFGEDHTFTNENLRQLFKDSLNYIKRYENNKPDQPKKIYYRKFSLLFLNKNVYDAGHYGMYNTYFGNKYLRIKCNSRVEASIYIFFVLLKFYGELNIDKNLTVGEFVSIILADDIVSEDKLGRSTKKTGKKYGYYPITPGQVKKLFNKSVLTTKMMMLQAKEKNWINLEDKNNKKIDYHAITRWERKNNKKILYNLIPKIFKEYKNGR